MRGSITSPAAARELPARPVRLSRSGIGEMAAIGALIAVAGLHFLLRHLLTRPFWGDEGWRAYDIALGIGFLHHLNASGAPLAPGWLAIEDGAHALFGSTESGLRLPMFLTLPAVGVATYLLARRWLGAWVSAAAAMLLLVNGWVVNNALQLESYTYEALFSIAAVGLFLLIRRAGRASGRAARAVRGARSHVRVLRAQLVRGDPAAGAGSGGVDPVPAATSGPRRRRGGRHRPCAR